MTKRKNHAPEFKAKVAREAIREEMTLAEMSKKFGIHATQISTWKRAAIENMASAFSKRGTDPGPVSAADIEISECRLFHQRAVQARIPFVAAEIPQVEACAIGPIIPTALWADFFRPRPGCD